MPHAGNVQLSSSDRIKKASMQRMGRPESGEQGGLGRAEDVLLDREEEEKVGQSYPSRSKSYNVSGPKRQYQA